MLAPFVSLPVERRKHPGVDLHLLIQAADVLLLLIILY